MSVERLSDSRTILRLGTQPENSLHTPSVNVMMNSVAAVFGNRALGVILTGMGSRAGAEGMTIHPATAASLLDRTKLPAVYGMPRVCAELGILSRIVPLPLIPTHILHATRSRKHA